MDPRKTLQLFATLVLCAVAAFCVSGFLATFEPLEEGHAMTWRVVYATLGALSVLGVLLLARRFRGGARDSR